MVRLSDNYDNQQDIINRIITETTPYLVSRMKYIAKHGLRELEINFYVNSQILEHSFVSKEELEWIQPETILYALREILDVDIKLNSKSDYKYTFLFTW